ncbi:hypothetical protein EX30DRAFT_366332 [Ascodesmis nigricans]|uniref:Uncharacterized protein n=1 Tax=Ascodesmis nigricans TaxID=341454 RepID=A0A4S2MRU1_9PEZI|nr:hypothetical protein EX30DRAFT_366332 [Ascodesmis nigricans]
MMRLWRMLSFPFLPCLLTYLFVFTVLEYSVQTVPVYPIQYHYTYTYTLCFYTFWIRAQSSLVRGGMIPSPPLPSFLHNPHGTSASIPTSLYISLPPTVTVTVTVTLPLTLGSHHHHHRHHHHPHRDAVNINVP